MDTVENAMSVEEVQKKYMYSSHNIFNRYNELSDVSQHPYIDEALEIYENKKQQLLERRRKANALSPEGSLGCISKPVLVANTHDMRKGAIVDRLRSKLRTKEYSSNNKNHCIV